jgi:hypothetical protein
MADDRDPSQAGCLINVAGWLSLAGLLATGAIGLAGGAIRDTKEPHWVGAAYLLIGGLAFGAVLILILRRWPSD